MDTQKEPECEKEPEPETPETTVEESEMVDSQEQAITAPQEESKETQSTELWMCDSHEICQSFWKKKDHVSIQRTRVRNQKHTQTELFIKDCKKIESKLGKRKRAKIESKLGNIKRPHDKTETLVGALKSLLKQMVVPGERKIQSMKNFDLSERFIDYLSNNKTEGQRFCVLETVKHLKPTGTPRTDKKGKLKSVKNSELYSKLSLIGAQRLAEKDPFFQHWIPFCIQTIQDQGKEANLDLFKDVIGKVLPSDGN